MPIKPEPDSINRAGQARVGLADAIRPDACDAIAELKRDGLGVIVLSGDRHSSTEHIGRLVGISQVIAECAPERKIREVSLRRAKGEVVAVVGDGINDAPALAEADVGIAMGSGTDLAREVGDITILGDGLHRIPWALRLAKRTSRVIRQNLIWAFGYNPIALGVAFLGYLHPLLAAIIMLGSSFFVLQNSIRLRAGDCNRSLVTVPGVNASLQRKSTPGTVTSPR